MAPGSPKSSPEDTCLGIWSTVLAEQRFRVPMDWMRGRR